MADWTPAGQARHRAMTHPPLAEAVWGAIEDYVRLYPGRRRPFVFSSHRDQLDCSRIPGACSNNSLHSRYDIAYAVDVDAFDDWSKTRDPKGYAADLWRLVQARSSCVRWGGDFRSKDYVHFEWRAERPGCSGGSAGSSAGGLSLVGTDRQRATAVLLAGAAVALVVALS